MEKQLRVLFPARDIEVGGELITLRPFAFGKLPKVISYLGDMIGLFNNVPEEVLIALQDDQADQPHWKMNPDLVAFFTTTVELGGDNIMNMMALAVNKPRAWVEELDPDDGLMLLMGVFEVNYDFFKQRLGPMFQTITGRAKSLSEMIKPQIAGQKS